jgi:glycosyltransferase involved in cell wall biosynthesis
MRILNEALGMRNRGHQIYFAVQKKGGLVEPLRKAGFVVQEVCFRKRSALLTLCKLFFLVIRNKIEVINTHSSLDSWIAGCVGRILRKRIVRTRHLSTAIRKGINSRVLYNFLASHVVTTCAEVVPIIQKQASLPKERICSIPTGVDPSVIKIDMKEVSDLRRRFGFTEDDIVIGSVSIFRGWKGIADLLHAAKLLQGEKRIKFLLVGSGVSEEYFRALHRELKLEESVFFAGHLAPPFAAIEVMSIFTLLSWAHEGVSQASLQAAYLKKPLITTETGGLKEVCLHEKTGLLVPVRAPEAVAQAILRLAADAGLRSEWGSNAKSLVEEKFLFERMLHEMEKVYGCSRRV